jgi:hypothetical protein
LCPSLSHARMLGFRYRTRQDVILRQHGLSASWNLLGCPLSARSRSPSRLRLGTCRHSCARLPAVNSPNRPPMAKPGCTCYHATPPVVARALEPLRQPKVSPQHGRPFRCSSADTAPDRKNRRSRTGFRHNRRRYRDSRTFDVASGPRTPEGLRRRRDPAGIPAFCLAQPLA